MKFVPPRKQLERQARRGFRGYPVGTVAFYGPDASRATKAAVGVVAEAGGEPVAMERWSIADGDARSDGVIGRMVLAYLEAHRVKSVVLSPGILGCPHEEGVDYPLGAECPQCPYWHGKDRWAGGQPDAELR
jgi:hypothetical protein